MSITEEEAKTTPVLNFLNELGEAARVSVVETKLCVGGRGPWVPAIAVDVTSGMTHTELLMTRKEAEVVFRALAPHFPVEEPSP